MRCPNCESRFEPIEYAAIGQFMCPDCGEIIDLLTYNNDDEDDDEY